MITILTKSSQVAQKIVIVKKSNLTIWPQILFTGKVLTWRYGSTL
jgi:hypothetical protein